MQLSKQQRSREGLDMGFRTYQSSGGMYAFEVYDSSGNVIKTKDGYPSAIEAEIAARCAIDALQ